MAEDTFQFSIFQLRIVNPFPKLIADVLDKRITRAETSSQLLVWVDTTNTMNNSCEREPGTHIIFIAGRNDIFSQVIVFLCIVNTATAVVSTIENFILLVTISRTRSLHSPSIVLLSGLALSDLAVSLIAQPVFVASNIADIYGNCNLFSLISKVHDYFSGQLLIVTALTVSATAVDRFLAIKIHLRYREFVTVRKTLLCLLCIWVTASTVATWISTHRSSAMFGVIVLVVALMFNNVTCYWKIYRTVCHHQTQIEHQFQVQHHWVQGTRPNITRYKRSVYSMLYIMGFFYLSFFPWVVLGITKTVINKGYTAEIVLVVRILFTISYLNACFNPLLYYWRMVEIRKAIKE